MIKVFKYFYFLLFFWFVSLGSAAQFTYDSHLIAARATGLLPIKNEAQLSTYIKKKKLVLVSANRGFTIARLTHSKPYLTPKSYSVLKQIGQSFYTKSKKKTVTVTSVTRTIYDQRRLSRVNRNAVRTKLSSHNFGCSFDISYIRFNKSKRPNPNLEKMLEDILSRMQHQGKLYFIKEYKEKCFHITTR